MMFADFAMQAWQVLRCEPTTIALVVAGTVALAGAGSAVAMAQQDQPGGAPKPKDDSNIMTQAQLDELARKRKSLMGERTSRADLRSDMVRNPGLSLPEGVSDGVRVLK